MNAHDLLHRLNEETMPEDAHKWACLVADVLAALLTRIEVLERRQAGWHPIPPAPALSGHELCVLTQAGSVREATDAEILAHPVVAALVARKFDRPEEP